jgi:hypothetical protein
LFKIVQDVYGGWWGSRPRWAHLEDSPQPHTGYGLAPTSHIAYTTHPSAHIRGMKKAEACSRLFKMWAVGGGARAAPCRPPHISTTAPHRACFRQNRALMHCSLTVPAVLCRGVHVVPMNLHCRVADSTAQIPFACSAPLLHFAMPRKLLVPLCMHHDTYTPTETSSNSLTHHVSLRTPSQTTTHHA